MKMADPAQSISRQHVFSGERLTTFSDAVFSIIATFSVIPLKFDREIVLESGGYRHFNLRDFLLDQWPKYLIYLYSFALVTDVWYVHSGVFSIVENVNDVILWLNLLLLFFVSFLPYATGLMSGYGDSLDAEQIAIVICTVVIAIIGVNLIIILGYAFRRQSLLHPHLVNNDNMRRVKLLVYLGLLVMPFLALVAFGFSFLPHLGLPVLLFYCILPISLLVRLLIYLFLRWRKSIEKLPAMIFRHVTSKSRAEAFSDGVFAIVATLIVLDLTSENIPTEDDLHKYHNGSLSNALYKTRFVYLSYGTTFTVTGLLWFVQYSMFHFITKFTPALSTTNTLSLFLVGGLPFVSEILSVFSDETFADTDTLGPNKILCLRAFCVLVTLIGLLQLLFWSVARHQKDYCMTDEIDNRCAETIMFVKIMILPLTAVIVYWGTFSETFIDYHLYTVAGFMAPFLFLFVKFLLRMCSCDGAKKALSRRRDGSPRSLSPTSIQQKRLPSPITSDESAHSPLLEKRAPVEIALHSHRDAKENFV